MSVNLYVAEDGVFNVNVADSVDSWNASHGSGFAIVGCEL